MLLTAKNKRVQAYIQNFTMNTKQEKIEAKKLKNKRIEMFEKLIFSKLNCYLSELFTKKQSEVIDEILYLTSRGGIWKIGMDCLAEKAKCSKRTVAYAVQKLKKTDQFIVARLGDGKAGIYIFVDKLHKNFNEIMEFVFNVDATQYAYQFATHENSENVDNTGSEVENQDSNNNNSIYLLKHDLKHDNNNNNKQSTNNKNQAAIETQCTIEEQKEKIEKYATNKFQKSLFNFICELPFLPKIISDNAYKIALSIGNNVSEKEYSIATKVVLEMVVDLTNKKYGIETSVRALFKTMYLNKLNSFRKSKCNVSENTTSIENTTKSTQKIRKVPFYNWLDEREESNTTNTKKQSYLPTRKGVPFYNWLDEREESNDNSKTIHHSMLSYSLLEEYESSKNKSFEIENYINLLEIGV